MKWECAECGASEETDKIAIDAACHHCGKPLCQKHRIALVDPAFAPALADPREAYHCATCKQKFHA